MEHYDSCCPFPSPLPPTLPPCHLLLQGDLLRELTLSRAHSLKEEQVRETILPQLLSALRYLHKRRIAHCDLRPENLFLTNKGHIKLGDFHHAVNLNVVRPAP